MATITGFHHLALTVTDVERSASWYSDLLGMVDVLGGDDDAVRYRVLAHPESGCIIGLREYASGSGDAFDEMRTGMDHVAFAVASAEELSAWEGELARRNVTFTPATVTPIGTVVAFRDPDNTQLEFWLPI